MRLNAGSISLTGAFVITNLYSGTVLDLSRSDQVTISGWTPHGGTNQQWTFAQDGPYYTIQNVAYSDKYVGYDGQVQQTQQGQHIIGVTSPALWALNQTNTDPPRYQFIVPDPASSDLRLVLDLYGGISNDGTVVQLYPNHGGDNQIWKVEPVSS